MLGSAISRVRVRNGGERCDLERANSRPLVLRHNEFRLGLLYCRDGIQIETPRVPSILKEFNADLVFFRPFEQSHPNHAAAKPVLTVLNDNRRSHLQRVVNRSQTRTMRSNVESVGRVLRTGRRKHLSLKLATAEPFLSAARDVLANSNFRNPSLPPAH
jgi:hypothetical protein